MYRVIHHYGEPQSCTVIGCQVGLVVTSAGLSISPVSVVPLVRMFVQTRIHSHQQAHVHTSIHTWCCSQQHFTLLNHAEKKLCPHHKFIFFPKMFLFPLLNFPSIYLLLFPFLSQSHPIKPFILSMIPITHVCFFF